MKKLFANIMALVLVGTVAEAVYATRLYQESGIIPNHSVEYVRTQNRSASTSADAAYYNPAGLVFMEKTGLSIMFSSQTYNVRKEHTMNYYAIKVGAYDPVQTFHTRDDFTGGLPDFYYAETVAPVLPDLCVVYRDRTKGHDWAVYLHLGVMQAANGMFFPRGLAVIDWGNLATRETQLAMTEAEASTSIFNSFSRDAEATRTEYFIGGTAGGVYKIMEWMSAALGARYIYYSGNMNIKVKDVTYVVDGVVEKDPDTEWNIDTDYSGHGGSVTLGLHFKPVDGLNIGFKYEYFTPVEMAKKTNRFRVNPLIETSGSLNLFKDGKPGKNMTYAGGNGESTFMMQYPMRFNLGLSYNILKNLKFEVSGELSLMNLRDMDGREDDYNDIGYRAGGCLEWWFIKNVCISVGYSYNEFGIKENKRNEADPLLPSHTIGAGLGIVINDRFDFNVGASYEYFIAKETYTTEYTYVTDPTYHYVHKTFDEYRISVALGLTYRFLGSSTSASEPESKKKMDLRGGSAQ
jgi:opacity protein-like surface antigen